MKQQGKGVKDRMDQFEQSIDGFKCNGTCKKEVCEDSSYNRICSECYISTEASTHTRRCFMTGEYCSQKTNIQRERNRLYKKNREGHISISAFIIMNFSDMSDVVYKWRIEAFIKSLKKYLSVDTESKKLYCNADKNDIRIGTVPVEEIKVIRSDSDPASNYVICSRICQQMQIADLIIVDVSSQNPNVFYEFGMAVALDKLILPICFSESFYKIEYPEPVQKMKPAKRKKAEHHIGCYPWQKNLFEYYGIRYKQQEKKKGKEIKYLDFCKAVKEEKGFADLQYNCFPYDAEIVIERKGKKKSKKIGKVIYEKLREQYNRAGVHDNTLVVYTMEGFLNEEQAGQCIVNFYHCITERMQKEQCFCGERVGVLVQENVIPESDKDAKKQRNLLYNVGEIIHIGVNQATYLAAKEKVESEDVYKTPEILKPEMEKGFTLGFKKDVVRFVKGHIRNRGMIIYPNNPVYVDRIKNMMPDDIFGDGEGQCYPLNAFCLYHVMLKNLRYTNEIVVDITNNCLQSLFWLGAAHGSEIYAITVKHELSEKEREIMLENPIDMSRNVFDVSGLWTAYYYSYDTEGFYHQLALAQFGIEKHSKIIPSNVSWHGAKRWEYFEHDDQEEDELFDSEKKSPKEESSSNKQKKDSSSDTPEEENEKDELQEKKLALESYYRRRFWNTMLRYNRLRIYLSQYDDTVESNKECDNTDKKDEKEEKERKNEPRVRAAKWDIDAASSLSHYLSKRSIIGEYIVLTLPKKEIDAEAKNVNFICVGDPTTPFEESLPKIIYEKFNSNSQNDKSINRIHKHFQAKQKIAAEGCEKNMKEIQIKGFSDLEQKEKGVFMYLPWADCMMCKSRPKEKTQKNCQCDISQLGTVLENCPWNADFSHTEIAQLILWRDDGSENKNNKHFRVSIVGSSGPATFGLSSLFVDEDQKLRDFLKKEKPQEGEEPQEDENSQEGKQNMLLYDLQARVREKIYALLMEELKKEIMSILKKTDGKAADHGRLEVYCKLVLYAVHSYLSTVLYRYFLPFLTEKDFHCIYNGIFIFLNSMKAARQSPFCLDYIPGPEEEQCPAISNDGVQKIIDMIPKKVRTFLEEFKGLEAFYEVEVDLKKENEEENKEENKEENENVAKDVREVKLIRAMKRYAENEQEIYFFMIPSNETKEETAYDS